MTDEQGQRRLLLADGDAGPTGTTLAVLVAEGFVVEVARSKAAALDRFGAVAYDLVLVAAGQAPDGALRLCRAVRARSEVPIIVLIGGNDEADVVEALDAGADDCIPLSGRHRELVARVRAALRRAPLGAAGQRAGAFRHPEAPQVFDIDGIRLDTGSLGVTVRGAPVEFPRKEFEVLAALMANAGRTLTRRVLLNRIWGAAPSSGSKTLDAHIRRVRAKIEDDPSTPTRIVTIRGLGYRYNQ